jgi:hypothetical protein
MLNVEILGNLKKAQKKKMVCYPIKDNCY